MPPADPHNDLKPTAAVEAVLFDFGMVLCGPPNPVQWGWMQRIAGLTEEVFHREYWAHRHPYDRGTHTAEEYWQLVSAPTGTRFTEDQVAGLILADIALWTDVNAPMVAWAGELQQAGIRTGILSNIGDAMESGVRAKFDWIHGFDYCIWSHRLKLAKPEAAIYWYAAGALKTEPAKILFIDDRLDNIEAARAVGMQAIQYRDHAQFLEEMHARGFSELLQPEGLPPAQRK